jgi:hypothetical protein
MKKKRIHFNEINEEIYTSSRWTKPRLFIISSFILIIGFLANFSLEDKINKFLLSVLQKNDACPIQFQKAELSYFLPKVVIKSITIPGSCFNQPYSNLPIHEVVIALHSPSFYPPGIRFHLSLKEGATKVHLYPSVSFFSQYIEVEKTQIDAKIFSVMTSDNKPPLAGIIDISGFLKIANNGNLTDGQLSLVSNNFSIPAQNIKGFNMSPVALNKFSIQSHFSNATTMLIDEIKIGKSNTPIELNLKGKINISPSGLPASVLSLNGTLFLSQYFLNNFSFVKIFFPPNNTTGKYQMKLEGPLGNLGPPQFY